MKTADNPLFRTIAKFLETRLAKENEYLAVRLAEENIWGCRRTAGELLRLGHLISFSTIRNILIPVSLHNQLENLHLSGG